MIKIFQKAILLLVLPLASLATQARAQDIPAVTGPVSTSGFQLPDTLGTLHYAMSGTQSVRTGYSGSGKLDWVTSVSGDVGYLSKSERRPFSFTYAGGYSHNSVGRSSGIFQNLTLTQSFIARQWTFDLVDGVRYLPEAPSSGLSGVPGQGDLGTGPIETDPGTGSEILSRIGQRVSNSTSANVTRSLTGSTSLNGGGSYFMQRFIGDIDGLNTNDISGHAGLTHRIDALSSAFLTGTYSHFSYLGANFSFDSESLILGYSRRWTRKINTSVSAGPSRTQSSLSSSGSLNYSANANVSYAGEQTSYSVRYSHGISGGSGVVPGALVDSASFIASRKFGRLVHANATVGYSSHTNLDVVSPVTFSIKTFVTNFQVSRTIAENLSGYLSYSIQKQINDRVSSSGTSFEGVSQIVALGITYSPHPVHLGHQ